MFYKVLGQEIINDDADHNPELYMTHVLDNELEFKVNKYDLLSTYI